MPFLDNTPNRIEPKYQAPYDAWKSKPSPATADNLLKAVSKDMDKGISAHVGQSNPLIRSRAKQLTLQAVRSYDPTKAKLSTHIINQLQGLKRIARQQMQILPIPERVSIDQGYVERAKAELGEELGRDANMAELADRTGLSLKRLKYVQKFRYPLATGTIHSVGEESEEGGISQPAVDQDRSHAWFDFVYSDLDDTNKKIMEWSVGLHDQPVLSNLEIARKLRMTPSAVSQRKSHIQQILDQQDLNPFA